MGVASRGADGCESAIYGDVASWKDLIVSVAQDAAERGGYRVPEWAASATVSDGGVFGGPLGRSCTSDCSDGYACYSGTGQPPGVCVPRCERADTECPSSYRCDTGLGACVPLDTGSEDEGCAVAPARSTSGAPMAVVTVLALGAAASLRRRRRS